MNVRRSALALLIGLFASGFDTPPDKEAVVFVITAADQQHLANGKRRGTGYFLNEFFYAYEAVIDAGYQALIATPDGRSATVDPEGLDAEYWSKPGDLERALATAETLEGFQSPLTLEDALERADTLAGLVVPGGQGVMVDLLDDPVLHELIGEVGGAGKPVGLICHAPAILTRLPAASNPFAGFEVTSVSRLEELYIERIVMGGRAETRRIGKQLSRGGYRYDGAAPKANHAVRDRNLVTSQNPFSGAAFSEAYLEALASSAR